MQHLKEVINTLKRTLIPIDIIRLFRWKSLEVFFPERKQLHASFYDLSMPAVMWGGYRQHKQYMKNAIGWLFYLPHHQSGAAEIYRS